GGQRFQRRPESVDRAAGEALAPALLDCADELMVETLRVQAPWGEPGDLAAARGRVRLLGGQVRPDQDAQRPADGLLGDAGRRREVAPPGPVRAQDAQN